MRKWNFAAEMALSSCFLFVCTEGISIFCYLPKSQYLPSSFRVFLPLTDGTKSSSSASSYGNSSTSSGARSKLHMEDLTIFVKKNDIKGVEQVLSSRPDFFVTEFTCDASYFIDLPLMDAVIGKKSEMVRLLVQYGADPNDSELLPSADIAMFPGYDKTERYRVYECTPPDEDYEATLMMFVGKIRQEGAIQTAAINGNVRLPEGLKKSHPGFSAVNLSGSLSPAINFERFDVIKWLIAHGADPNWKNESGISMMDLGLKSKSKEIKSYFKELKNCK